MKTKRQKQARYIVKASHPCWYGKPVEETKEFADLRSAINYKAAVDRQGFATELISSEEAA